MISSTKEALIGEHNYKPLLTCMCSFSHVIYLRLTCLNVMYFTTMLDDHFNCRLPGETNEGDGVCRNWHIS